MAIMRYLVPALALAASVSAQQCSGDLTVQNQGDAASIENCQTYKGSITISPNAAGQIALNGVKQITGDLTCSNAGQLTEISADQLGSIGGIFGLKNLTIMSTLAFSSLNSVDSIQWVGLPALQGLNFPQGVSQASSVLISNTQLNTLSGIELQTVGDIDINNNPYLDTVNVNDIKEIQGSLNFAANSMGLEITFPNLQQANNLTFRNVSSVSMPSLSLVNGSLGFYSDSFESFSAPNLTQTGGALAFVDSPNLKNLSFPQLRGIGGGFLIANNTALKSINGFPKLQVVVGALDFAGTFDNATVPALKDGRGGLNVQTTSSTFDCSPFKQDCDSKVVKGVCTCAIGQKKPNTNPSAASSGSSPSSTSSSKNNANSFNPSTPLTGLGALLAALLMI